MAQDPTPQRAPEYVVLHNNVGGQFNRGDTIPHGTYDDEQLARLVGLGAIQPYDPPGLPVRDPVAPAVPPAMAVPPGTPGAATAPPSPVRSAPQSAEELKARQDAAALEAAGGPPADLEPNAHGIGPDTDGGPNPDDDPLSEVSDEQAAELRGAGFGDAASIRAASDEQLLAVPGVGPAAVRRLREAVRE